MAAAQTLTVSPVILLTLFVVLVASSAVFWLLSWRSTSHRRSVALSEWGKEKGFYFRPVTFLGTPAPFHQLSHSPTHVRMCMANRRTTLMQFQTVPGWQPPEAAEVIYAGKQDEEGDPREPFDRFAQPPAAGTSPVDAPSLGAKVAAAASRHETWHVLIRRVGGDWKPTGLRPAGAGASALDLFSLASFPTLGDVERFVVYGTDSEAARALGGSFARALLPRDIGLLLHGRYLVLDFSDRQFDTIEFNRMLALADQVASHLPSGAP